MTAGLLIRIAGLAAALVALGGAECRAQAPPQEAATFAIQGKRTFLRCASCHELSARGITKIGPNLDGVVGRKAGSLPGYVYSPAMRAVALTWDEATLDRWLTKPNAVVPGTSMAFAGLPKVEDRKAVIAYLKSH